MPITPVTDRPETYTVRFTKDGIEFEAKMTSPGGTYAEQDADDAVQALVDHLEGWADSIDSADKTRTEVLSITPTP